ncbi:sugar ABC transporter permease, partial [Romboutsia weinsteinii]
MKSNNLRKKERSVAFFFLFFPILLLVTFGLLPIFHLFQYSVTSWNGLSDVKEFVGADNFIKIITDPDYIK